MPSQTQNSVVLFLDERELKRGSISRRRPVSALATWVLFCVFLNCAGWGLSALHALNRTGYAISFALAIAAMIFWQRKTRRTLFPVPHWGCLKRRFRRPFALGFLIPALLAILGGALYPPSNYDALAYRIPRILRWLADERWDWIHSVFPRLNTRACGVEWVSAPGIALFQSDRLLFLVNVVSFLLLPGLLFSVFTRLGVRPRVAWHWMWIVPTGYGFLLQAGSIGNDMFGAVFALAAVHFALRAKASGCFRDFGLSLLAAGMLTACKLSNLTLLLPWALALLPSMRLAFRRPMATALVCAVALAASLLFTLIANVKHGGDWTGMALEQPGKRDDLVLRTGGNVVMAVAQNLVPPVFPMAEKWSHAPERVLPADLIERWEQTLESSDSGLGLGQMQIEENAGLGFGVSLLLLASVAAVALGRRQKTPSRSLWENCVRWSPYISFFVMLTQSNLLPIARLLAPYYGLMLPVLLAGAEHERLVRRRWWRAAAFGVFALATVIVIVSPARPLFPALTLLDAVKARAPESSLRARAEAVYSTYRDRPDAFAPARAALPPGLKTLGLITFDDPETSLWRPFGSRRIVHICAEDTSADLKQIGVEYILVKEDVVVHWFNLPFDQWQQRMNAEVVQKIPLKLRASTDPFDWYLVRLR